MSSGFRKVQLHTGSLCESGTSLGLSFLIVEMGVMTLGTGRTVCPQNFYIKVLTPETSKCHCICRRTFQEAIKLKRGCEVGPLSSRTSVFIRNRDQKADGRRRKTPRRRSKSASEERGLGRNQLRWLLDLGPPAPRTVRKHVAAV